MIKQIYASLEIAEKEVRLLVAEYYNTRFNIIKLTKVPCDGVDNFEIYDRSKVKTAIETALKETANKIGTKIERVILLIPPVNFKRYPLKVNAVPEFTGLRKSDIVRAISHTLDVEVDNDVMVINRIPLKYSINGIASRRFMEGEICDEVIVDVDLLCADKKITYDYVSIVEECGLEVLDICLSSYAICKEGVLIENSLSKNLIVLDVNSRYTNLSLLYKGKLLSSEIIDSGLNDFIKAVYNKYPLPYNTLARLVKYDSSSEENNTDVIFTYSKDNKNYTITHKELNQIIERAVKQYIDQIVAMCAPIMDKENVTFVLVGEGADMNYLAQRIETETGKEVNVYHPDTLGVRESNLIGLFGSFFAMKETANLRDMKVVCVDLVEFEKIVEHNKIDVEGETLTTKIKTLFEQYRNKENIK